MTKKATEQELLDFFSSLARDGKLFAVSKSSGKWQRIDDVSDIANAFDSTFSPKNIFMPQDQSLLKFSLTDPIGTIEGETSIIPTGTVLWGMHPCDARAIDLIHRVFNENEYRDPYFNAVWNGIIRIAVGCTEPQATCFCTSFAGGSPFGTQGVDILATKLDSRWIFEPITQTGDDFMKSFEPASDNDIAQLTLIKKHATEKVDCNVPTDIAATLWSRFDDNRLWQEIGDRCLGCGICTFVCPSCYCFDINNEHIDKNARRYRTWDACQFSLFTQEASGHNPRPTQKERIRQRMMHKLSFFAKRYDGTQLCVGCGRCVRECPVNIDIRDIAQRATT